MITIRTDAGKTYIRYDKIGDLIIIDTVILNSFSKTVKDICHIYPDTMVIGKHFSYTIRSWKEDKRIFYTQEMSLITDVDVIV